MKLGEYLKSLEGTRRKSGIHDCSTFPANWCIVNGYNDPMLSFRGMYNTEEESIEIVKSYGGLNVVFDECLSGIGIDQCDTARIGDIATIRIGEFEAGAICTGPRWAFVGGKGLCISHVRQEYITAIWALNCNG